MLCEANLRAGRPNRSGITGVIPVFSERESIQTLLDEGSVVLEDLGSLLDFIFVDDGGTVGSKTVLDEW